MTLLAGCDVVVEIRKEAFLALLQLGIGDRALAPTAFAPWFTDGGMTVRTDLIVDSVAIVLDAASQRLSLVYTFSNSVLFIGSDPPGPQGFSPSGVGGLAGTFAISAPLAVESSQPSGSGPLLHRVSWETDVALLSVAFDTASARSIDDHASTTGMTLQRAEAWVKEALAVVGLVGPGNSLSLPSLSFAVSGSDTGLEALRFARLEVQIVNQDVVALLGHLFPSGVPAGPSPRKTAVALEADRSLAVILAPHAFQHFVVCPSLQQVLLAASAVKQPNAGCDEPHAGYAGHLDSHTTVDEVRAVLAPDTLTIGGRFRRQGVDIPTHGTVRAHVAFAMQQTAASASTGEQVTATVQFLGPGDLSIQPSGLNMSQQLQTVGALAAGLNRLAGTLAGKLTRLQLGILGPPGTGGPPIGSDGNGSRTVTLQEIALSPDAVVFQGDLTVTLPLPLFWNYHVRGLVTTIGVRPGSSGTYHSTLCPPGDWAYQEVDQLQLASYSVMRAPVDGLFSVVWSLIGADGVPVPLLGAHGTATVSARSTYVLPPPGGTQVSQPIHVDYQISGPTINLRNAPGEGNFSLVLEAHVDERSGPDPTISYGSVDTSSAVDFVGQQLNFIDSNYYAELQACMQALLAAAGQAGHQYQGSPFPPVPPFASPAALDPQQLLDVSQALLATGSEEGWSLLLLLQNWIGSRRFGPVDGMPEVVLRGPGLTGNP